VKERVGNKKREEGAGREGREGMTEGWKGERKDGKGKEGKGREGAEGGKKIEKGEVRLNLDICPTPPPEFLVTPLNAMQSVVSIRPSVCFQSQLTFDL